MAALRGQRCYARRANDHLGLLRGSFYGVVQRSYPRFADTYGQQEPRRLPGGWAAPVPAPLCYPLGGVSPNAICTLIFTSGTTALPKAVELTHANIIATAETMQRRRLLYGDQGTQEYTVSYLPLAHIFQRVLQAICWEATGAQGYLSEDTQGLLEDIQAVGPTALYLVPRVVEKIYNGVRAQVRAAGPVARAAFALAYGVR